MTQKNLLISSMQKLTNHVRKSQENQQEIFYSLSRNDFKKIMSNLQDENPMLRKTSLNLIAQLMSQNNKLKNKFCKIMHINLIPGNVIFNSKIIQKYVASTNFPKLLSLLKIQPDFVQTDCLLWFINVNSKNRQLQIQYIYKDKNKIEMQVDIDPHQCIVGFCLPPFDLGSQFSMTNISVTTTQVSEQPRKAQLRNLIQQNPKKLIYIGGTKVDSYASENQSKYQRNDKSIQLQTDQPKNFMNNFLHQRKINGYKGSQTQRLSTLNSQNVNYIGIQSFQTSSQIQRLTMPKTTQSPYIPTLNFKNASNNAGLRTEKIEQIFTKNNRAKQLDFQKIKYQGIKITTNATNRSSYGNYVPRCNTDRNNTERNNTYTERNNTYTDRNVTYTGRNNTYTDKNEAYTSNGFNNNLNGKKQTFQTSFNFKYIKPISTVNQEGAKMVNFFPKRYEDQPHLIQKKTIDVFQYIKNR